MKDQLFAVIDVETTGGGINGNRLTEICIVLMRGTQVIDKFSSLINPEKEIPRQITALTGIDNAMVSDAPKFYEVAKQVEEMTRDAIFVAHNVNFDYNVLRNEFKELGFDYSRRKLCTVRLSRKLIPGLFSYSLGRLCDSINIPISNRHRAEGDTDATVILFQRLLALDEDEGVIASFLHAHSRQATLPPHIEAEQVHRLPEAAGIYLFKDRQHKVIYAGKAIDIKKRVVSHFYDRMSKEYQLGQETYHIDHEATGSWPWRRPTASTNPLELSTAAAWPRRSWNSSAATTCSAPNSAAFRKMWISVPITALPAAKASVPTPSPFQIITER